MLPPNYKKKKKGKQQERKYEKYYESLHESAFKRKGMNIHTQRPGDMEVVLLMLFYTGYKGAVNH